MKREIKFRAWDKENAKMIYDFDQNISKEYFLKIGDSIHNLVYQTGLAFDTLQQYTGLNDKKGKEIYEGDYLVDRFPIDEEDLSKGYNESLLPVVWCEKKLMWCVDVSFAKDGSYLTSLVEYFGEFLEVKGNIHENKELL